MNEGFGNGTFLFVGDLIGEPEVLAGSFTGDPEGYVKKGSGNGHLSP